MSNSHTRLRRLGPQDYRVMPWKNGGGVTTEIAVDPPGADLGAFDWRLSLAELQSSNAFSSFPEHDRVILQLSGAPMTLTHDDQVRKVLRPFVPYRFDGASATVSELVEPARDFNVMTRKGKVLSQVWTEDLARGTSLNLQAETAVIYTFRGTVHLRAGDAKTTLNTGESAVLTNDSTSRFATEATIDAGSDATLLITILTLRR